jgi:hypothetical protein
MAAAIFLREQPLTPPYSSIAYSSATLSPRLIKKDVGKFKSQMADVRCGDGVYFFFHLIRAGAIRVSDAGGDKKAR